MTKFYDIKKSKYFHFGEDMSMEFAEYFCKVFVSDKKIYLVYNSDVQINMINLEDHVVDYYVAQRGWKQVIFLKQSF